MGEPELEPTLAAAAPEAVDPAMLSAMMAQMQALMAEVTELRQAVAQQQGPVSVGEEEDEDLAARFARVLSESGSGELVDEGDEEVTAEETADLLAGVDNVLSAGTFDDDDEAESSVFETARPVFYVEETVTEAVEEDLEEQPGVEEAVEEPVSLKVVEGVVSVDPETDEQDSVEGIDPAMSDDEISRLMAEIEGGAVAAEEEPDLGAGFAPVEPAAPVSVETVEPSLEDDWDDEEMPSEDEMLAMVKGAIEAQNEAVESDEGAENAGRDPNVLSVDQLSAMLNEPDLSMDDIPIESQAMDEDELARLLIEAQGQDLDGVETGSSFGQNPPKPKVRTDESEATSGSGAGASTSKVDSGPLDTAAVKAVPAHLAVRAMAVPVRFQDGKLVCHVAEPIDRPALDMISRATGFGVVAVVRPINQVVSELRDAYSEVRDDHARWAIRASRETKPSVLDTVKSVLRRIA